MVRGDAKDKRKEERNNEAEQPKWFSGLRVLWVIGAVTSLVLIWAIEQPVFVPYPHLQLFFREVAFALLIASVFGLTIDRIQRTEFIRLVTDERNKLKRDVFLYAYGSNLPDQIRQEIRKSILNQSFHRYDLTIDWEFALAQNDLLSVKKRYRYFLFNNSTETLLWPFVFIQIGADIPGANTSTFECLRITRGHDTTTYTLKNNKELKSETPEGQPHTRKISTDIEINPLERVGIYYEVSQLRRSFGEDKYSSRESVVGTTRVMLRFPAGFDVQVSCKTKALRPDPDDDPPLRHSLTWDEGILPYQGVTISWSKKEGPKPAAVALAERTEAAVEDRN
jgi:hypothetical protein